MTDDFIAKLTDQFPGLTHREFRGQQRMDVPADRVLAILGALKDHGFDYLVDITCVDYLQYRAKSRDDEPAGRFGLTYLLANITSAARITLRAYLDDEDHPTVSSAVSLWEGANWLEREVFDMFGIHFDGHPDLRRILMPAEFTAHPLRKDYPLQGRGERHNFPVIARGQG
jgi:NADH-quinone oxidoreductase subunit C